MSVTLRLFHQIVFALYYKLEVFPSFGGRKGLSDEISGSGRFKPVTL
jgi:hypothetical protein